MPITTAAWPSTRPMRWPRRGGAGPPPDAWAEPGRRLIAHREPLADREKPFIANPASFLRRSRKRSADKGDNSRYSAKISKDPTHIDGITPGGAPVADGAETSGPAGPEAPA